MSRCAKIFILAALLAAAWPDQARAAKETVCTITVNSPDEKQTFQRNLPADKFQFVELVERGRRDWLASACQQHVRCDVLVISGHYDGRDEFYSDQPNTEEFLPADELERASCSPSCSGLFSQLKEVYLFGCNTLNPEALKRASAEVSRSLIRAGYSPVEAQRLSQSLGALHSGSSRNRMRLIFKDVPVIYGFSAKAPVGPVAASMLSSYLRSGGREEVGSGRASSRLLNHFAKTSLAVSSGAGDSDPLAPLRRDSCQFSNDALTAAQRIDFVHRLLQRDPAEARLFLDRIEQAVAAVGDSERQTPEVAKAFDEIAQDQNARATYLAFARDADSPVVRARMIKLATGLGWLSAAEERAELMGLVSALLSNHVSPADVDLVCALNKDHRLDAKPDAFPSTRPTDSPVAAAAVFACLGSEAARAQVLRALTSPSVEDVRFAQVYLHHRPITDVDELRDITASIARMSDPAPQVQALDALAGQHVSDPEALEELTRLFPVTESVAVQEAIAGVLIRSDLQAIASPRTVEMLRAGRLKSPQGEELIDALINRLQLL
jgi:hypothetical protein